MHSIEKIAVVGAGTMGAGIAGICASAGLPVVLLDISRDASEAALGRLTGGRKPILTTEQAANIVCGSIENDLALISDADWICEAVIEDLGIKRKLLSELDPLRKPGSIVTTNTSGIPLRDIAADQSEQLQAEIAVTHFFNPVHIMRLLELVPGANTTPEVVAALATFMSERLGKGVVYAKDTVNFIGNRIGCFWMLAGLHKATTARHNGLSQERIDAVLSRPIGLPATGLYGLVDLIGLDVMDHVARNLRDNLPEGDAGRAWLDFPDAERQMMERGQLGRKTGGGYYRMNKHDDGTRSLSVFDLDNSQWRDQSEDATAHLPTDLRELIFDDSAEGQLVWDLMSDTLCYTADLVPAIADDIVNIDRAMRWGFNWQFGPFELIDEIGVDAFAEKLVQQNRPLPAMVNVLLQSDSSSFYNNGNYLSVDGQMLPMPPE
jgi:3-hydroxyacyl-CoA dehydrogenase